MLRAIFTTLPLVVIMTASAGALAQSPDAATAELLFQQGRDLLRAGKAADACPKLAESQRLDPATGTLLALAMCHEADGKLASAWAEFTTVQAQARSENRQDREDAARERAAALKGKLSTLEIRVAPALEALPGLVVRRDGVELGRGVWNLAVPLDGGLHVVEVTATGKRSYRQQLELKNEKDQRVLEVPALADVPVTSSRASGDAVGGATGPTYELAKTSKSWGKLEWAGVGAAGAGAVALGVGGYFLSVALGKNSDSNQDCTGNRCHPQGYADRMEAISKGNTATILGVAGGVLVASGATLFIVGRSRSAQRDTGSVAVPRLAVGTGPHGLGAQLSGDF